MSPARGYLTPSESMSAQQITLSNVLATAITEHYGFVPLRVRYQAADAAIAVLRDYESESRDE